MQVTEKVKTTEGKSDGILEVPPPLCGHNRPLRFTRSYRASCPECGSFWDRDFISADITYDHSYPERRSHFDPVIGALKVRTLQHWIDKLGIRTTNSVVCEVGFGGGFCLSYLRDVSRNVFGVEAIPENIEHAVKLGIKTDSLYHAGALPAALPENVDLWVFQDSFEHLDEPMQFLRWVGKNSSAESKIIIVAPNGGSLSEKFLGKWWLHKVSDHRFHWSKKGLVEFFSRNGFVVVDSFFPGKYISFKMVVAHMVVKVGGGKRMEPWFSSVPLCNHEVLFNIGEMGLLFRKA